MEKIIKPATLLILQLLAVTFSYCQGQENMIDSLAKKFEDYVEAVPREEIYIHTDREEYIGGEDLWFNIYLINRQSFKPCFNSRIAYFELLNYDNRPVVQKRILLNKGFGPGRVKLPDTLSSGTYTIRSYTNWMKNFLPVNCFIKNIKIYNAFNNKKFIEKTSLGKSVLEEFRKKDFLLNKNTGIRLKAEILESDELEIIISANEEYISEYGNLFYLIIQTHGILDHKFTERIAGNNTKVIVPVKSLTPGINQITVFDQKGRPVCQKYTYTPYRKNQYLPIASADTCGTREKIVIGLEPEKGITGSLNDGNLSISIIPETNVNHFPDLRDYLIFGTEFGINNLNISIPDKIADTPQEFIDSILLNIKSNWTDWTEILSDKIPDFKYQAEKEDHLLPGRLLENDKSLSAASEMVLLYMPGRDAEFQYAKTDNEGNFNFNIHIDEDYKDLVIMPKDVSKKHKIILESPFYDQFIKSGISVDTSGKKIPSYFDKWSVNYQIRKIYGDSAAGNSLYPVFLPLKPVRFYGKPDIELIMADYVSLPKMEEVFFELLPGVSLKKRNSFYKILITDRINENRYELSPNLFLDGVEINDPSIIADIDPSAVERIDIVKEKYIIGEYSYSGIVNVITKPADFSYIPLPDYMIRLSYRVIEPVFTYVSPDYSSEEIRNRTIPDYRNTLYWNPTLKTDKTGKITAEFWTSDVVSGYDIQLQGITSEGEIICARKSFIVK